MGIEEIGVLVNLEILIRMSVDTSLDLFVRQFAHSFVRSLKKSFAENMTKKPSSSTKKLEPDDVYADADDDNYGMVRDPNFHNLEYCNRRRRCRFMDSCNGNDDDDCSYFDDPNVAVTCLRPILPSPFRELSYKSRTGWKYDPSSRNTPVLDRLGTGVADVKFFGKGYGRQQKKKRPRQQGNISEKTEKDDENGFALAASFPMPSTKMIIPISWTSSPSVGIGGINNGDKNKNTTELNSEKRKNVGNISNSAIEGSSKSNKRSKLSGDTATIVTISTAGYTSCFANDTRMSQDDKIKNSADSFVKGLPPPYSASLAATPSATAAAAAMLESSVTKPQKQRKTSSNESGIAATTLVSPKEVLYIWYGKKLRKTQIKPAQYMTWDTGRQNDQQFSAIFVCPMTNEAFLAGPRTDDNKTSLTAAAPDKDGLYWFPRKIIAEHAAAARAYDCLAMRASGGINGSIGRLCGLEPYWPSQRPTWPIEGIPAQILERLSPEQYPNTTNTDPLNKNSHDEVRTDPKTTLVKADTDISSRTVDNDKEERKGQDNKHSKKNLVKRESTLRVGGQKRNYGGGHRHARRQSPQNQNNSSDNYNDHNPKVRDVEHYRAQRMPYGQRDRYSQYQTNHQPRHEQQQMTESGFSYSPNTQQRETRQQGQFGSTILQYGQNQVSQGIQHQIPERSHFGFQQHQQQNQYLEQQSNSNNFQYARNTHNQHNLQHSQQPILIPPPPPPPPPPPLEPSRNHPKGWNSHNQYDDGSFGNNNRSQHY